jgi:sugar fermentation stimulation protein A
MEFRHMALYPITSLKEGTFLDRPNRFVGIIRYQSKVYHAHIHDPGRLTELLVKGRKILFNDSRGKLDYYIRAVKIDEDWILIDTAQHSKIALYLFKYLPEFAHINEIKREVQIGKSRIDFMLDGVPLEVKGVTLVKRDLALFPDAPTERGTRHVKEIIESKGKLLFLIFRNAKYFGPNHETDPKFTQKLSEARSKGIQIITAKISFDGFRLYYEGEMRLFDF